MLSGTDTRVVDLGNLRFVVFNLLLSKNEVNSICKDVSDRDFDIPSILNILVTCSLGFCGHYIYYLR